MKKLMILAFLALVYVGSAEGAARDMSFYGSCGDDPTVKTVEDVLMKTKFIPGGEKKFRLCNDAATPDEIRERLNYYHGYGFKTNDEVVSFFRSRVVAKDCGFWDDDPAIMDVIQINARGQRSYRQWKRNHEKGEKCAVDKVTGVEIQSFLCGNTRGVEPRRLPPPLPLVLLPQSPPPPAKPVILGGPVEVKPEKKKCVWVVESTPSGPISVGVLGGVSNRGTGVVVGSSMSIGASHRQETCN